MWDIPGSWSKAAPLEPALGGEGTSGWQQLCKEVVERRTHRDIHSFIPALRAGQEVGTKGMAEQSGIPTALVRQAAPDHCCLQLISALQDSAPAPAFPGGAGDTQTVPEHHQTWAHCQASFKHPSMELQPHPAGFR